MGRRPVSDSQRGALLEAFREDIDAGSPASFRRAAARAGTDWRTARRFWERGWPGIRPVRETIEHERVLARAALRREALEQRLSAATALAVEDAVENRARQGQIVRAVTVAAMNEYVEVHNAKAKLIADTPEAKAALRAHRQYADILGRVSEILERGQRMESIVLGTPTQIHGGEITLRPASSEEPTVEQAVAVDEALKRAIDYARDEQPPKLLEGGDGSSAKAQ